MGRGPEIPAWLGQGGGDGLESRPQHSSLHFFFSPGFSGDSREQNVCRAVTTQRPSQLWTVMLEDRELPVAGQELTGNGMQEAQVKGRTPLSAYTGGFLPLFWFSSSEKKRELERG